MGLKKGLSVMLQIRANALCFIIIVILNLQIEIEFNSLEIKTNVGHMY